MDCFDAVCSKTASSFALWRPRPPSPSAKSYVRLIRLSAAAKASGSCSRIDAFTVAMVVSNSSPFWPGVELISIAFMLLGKVGSVLASSDHCDCQIRSQPRRWRGCAIAVALLF